MNVQKLTSNDSKHNGDYNKYIEGPEKMERKLELSFAGCGFLGMYHVGAIACFKQNAFHLIEGQRIAGASAGALAAAGLLCDIDFSEYLHLCY